MREKCPFCWKELKRGALDTLVQLDGRDFLHRLSDEHLAQVATNLDKLAQKAAKMLLERVG